MRGANGRARSGRTRRPAPAPSLPRARPGGPRKSPPERSSARGPARTPVPAPLPPPPAPPPPSPLTYTPPPPPPGPFVTGDPGRDGWGPYGPPSAPPGWFFETELQFIRPVLKDRLSSDAPLLSGA